MICTISNANLWMRKWFEWQTNLTQIMQPAKKTKTQHILVTHRFNICTSCYEITWVLVQSISFYERSWLNIRQNIKRSTLISFFLLIQFINKDKFSYIWKWVICGKLHQHLYGNSQKLCFEFYHLIYTVDIE